MGGDNGSGKGGNSGTDRTHPGDPPMKGKATSSSGGGGGGKGKKKAVRKSVTGHSGGGDGRDDGGGSDGGDGEERGPVGKENASVTGEKCRRRRLESTAVKDSGDRLRGSDGAVRKLDGKRQKALRSDSGCCREEDSRGEKKKGGEDEEDGRRRSSSTVFRGRVFVVYGTGLDQEEEGRAAQLVRRCGSSIEMLLALIVTLLLLRLFFSSPPALS